VPNPASTADLSDRRPLTDTEQLSAYSLLEQAWAILQARSPGLDARMLAGLVDPVVVRSVLVSMVLRVLDNPQGLRQGSRTIDDFTESWTRDTTTSSGALYVTGEELDLLSPITTRRGAFTIRAVPEPPLTWDARR
jgi:hypothetical protein